MPKPLVKQSLKPRLGAQTELLRSQQVEPGRFAHGNETAKGVGCNSQETQDTIIQGFEPASKTVLCTFLRDPGHWMSLELSKDA